MEFKIRIMEQTEDGLFSEVLDEHGNRVCIGEGINPYSALEDACLVFADILKDFSRNEEKNISRIIKERFNIDNGEKYSIDKVKDIFTSLKENNLNPVIIGDKNTVDYVLNNKGEK